MTEDILEPVLNDKNKPMWLVKKNGKFCLKKPNIWRCVSCGTEMISNKNPTSCKKCNKNQFDRIAASINPDVWKLPKWKDIPTKQMKTKNIYKSAYKLIKRCVVFHEEIHYKLFTLWCISTWKIESWNSVGFLTFIGLPDSGKTRALDVAREICYRMIHGAHCTFPAMVRATHFYGAGVLIDEIQSQFNSRTDTGKKMIDFVKPSYRRGSCYLVADIENQDGILSYKNFGFKAFAGERSFDSAMLSRSIVFYMEKAEPEIQDLKYVQSELDELQNKLLNYRYKIGSPPDLGEDFLLKGRSREIFDSIISTGIHLGVDVSDVIEYAINLKKEVDDSLQDTIEYEILLAIFELSSEPYYRDIAGWTDPPTVLYYKDIMKQLYPDYDNFGPYDIRTKGGKLGYKIKSLNLKTKKTKTGTCLDLYDKRNKNRLEILFKRYGIAKND